MDDDILQCADCGAHFTTDPRGGDIQGAACSECGGTRFNRSQPSPVNSDGALRNMVDMSSGGIDRGGNPMGEGMITAGTFPSSDTVKDTVDSDSETPGDPWTEGTIVGDEGVNDINSGQGHDEFTHSKVLYTAWDEPFGSTPEWEGRTPEYRPQGQEHEPEFGDRNCPNCGAGAYWRDSAGLGPMYPNGAWECQNGRCGYMIPGDERKQETPEHPDPWMDNEPGTVTFPQHWTSRTLNMDPYPALWSDEHVAGLLDMIPQTVENAALFGAGIPLDETGIGEAMQGMAVKNEAQDVGHDLGSSVGQGLQPAPTSDPTQAPNLYAVSSDLETPSSVPSVDEQEDDPNDQDQKQFDDGDKSPTNLMNPNNEDSGFSGEDGPRQDHSRLRIRTK